MPYSNNSYAGRIPVYLSQHLSADGTGLGQTNFNGDYSATPMIAHITPDPGTTLRLYRMIVNVTDSNGMTQNEYGDLKDSLTNGIQVQVKDDSGVITDLTGGIPIKTNGAWGNFSYDVNVINWGAGPESLLVRWSFFLSGTPIRLDGEHNERFEVILNDDFTGLTTQSFVVQGYYEQRFT
jgi:hypothetical protein